MPRMRAGAWGWVGLWGYIVTYDAWLIRRRKATLSEVFGEAVRHPVKRWPVMVAWVAVTLHLFSELIPEPMKRRLAPIDPIAAMGRLIEPQ